MNKYEILKTKILELKILVDKIWSDIDNEYGFGMKESFRKIEEIINEMES